MMALLVYLKEFISFRFFKLSHHGFNKSDSINIPNLMIRKSDVTIVRRQSRNPFVGHSHVTEMLQVLAASKNNINTCNY